MTNNDYALYSFAIGLSAILIGLIIVVLIRAVREVKIAKYEAFAQRLNTSTELADFFRWVQNNYGDLETADPGWLAEAYLDRGVGEHPR